MNHCLVDIAEILKGIKNIFKQTNDLTHELQDKFKVNKDNGLKEPTTENKKIIHKEVPITPEDLAEYLIEKYPGSASNSMTLLCLSKLLYRAYVRFYKNTGKWLFEDKFEAWQYGPIIPNIWDKYRNYGACTLEPAKDYIIGLSPEIENIINESIKEFSKLESWEQVKTSKSTAWKRVIDEKGIYIPLEYIKNESKEEHTNAW